MRVREAGNGEQYLRVTPSDIPVYENPFLYLADVIRGKTDPGEHGLYSLNTNVTVVRILEAARQSAKAGKTIYLDSSTGRSLHVLPIAPTEILQRYFGYDRFRTHQEKIIENVLKKIHSLVLL